MSISQALDGEMSQGCALVCKAWGLAQFQLQLHNFKLRKLLFQQHHLADT